jgi:hypothetical protein
MDLYFSDHFKVSPKLLARYGGLDISLVADLPLFIDPFLLFNSRRPAYRRLHDEMIQYLRFLKDKSVAQSLTPPLVDAWYRFPEIRQTWLGFSASSNYGHGLGSQFAQSLDQSLHKIFRDFGEEEITKGSHLEKLCLIKDGVGRDNISDFTTNLILGFLCEYTAKFASQHIAPTFRRAVAVERVAFNYETESWEHRTYDLPWFRGDFVLLTPVDILTKDDTWINRRDLVAEFPHIPDAIPNVQLRAQVNNYFRKVLPRRPKKADEDAAALATIYHFPELIDYYIRYKEDHGDTATSVSARKVEYSKQLYIQQFRELPGLLTRFTAFYSLLGTTYDEAQSRVAFLKDVIENKGGHRLFYVDGKPIERELDVQIMYRLTWFATDSDVSREVNDGRGPADFKASRGARDKTIVEFKLAKNSQLKRNLQKQTKIYAKASDARKAITVIIYFSRQELARVQKILKDLSLADNADVVLIDARKDNKPSGSKA